MRKITEKELTKRIGEETFVEREGVVGNYVDSMGKAREGELTGILEHSENGFYVKMFRPYFGELHGVSGISLRDKSSFIDEPYMLQQMDIIHFLTLKRRTFGKSYSVKLS